MEINRRIRLDNWVICSKINISLKDDMNEHDQINDNFRLNNKMTSLNFGNNRDLSYIQARLYTIHTLKRYVK
jgi:hypothetical protein